MVEEHLISLEFANNKEGAALLLSKDKSISIMVNEEDHLRIQALGKGLNIYELYESADKVDNKLDSKLNFSYSDRLGYLTYCPSNLGTGLRASVMMHLPALTESGLIGKVITSVGQMGLTVRGLYGEGTQPGGCIYQVSNQVSLGQIKCCSISDK
jgi:protein arginine kinase